MKLVIPDEIAIAGMSDLRIRCILSQHYTKNSGFNTMQTPTIRQPVRRIRANSIILLLSMSWALSGVLPAFGAPGDPDLKIVNDVIEVGISKDFGGALTWLAVADSDRNLINNHDKGRQVQQSYYAGKRLDRTAEGQSEAWTPWSWNPVQAGDAFGNKSKILEARSDGKEIYTKVQPLLWDMNDELSESRYETWITLEGSVVHVRNRLTCFRSAEDRWGVSESNQELPAVYTIGELSTLYTYDGNAPWTRGALTIIEPKPYPGFPWPAWTGQEKWAAHVNAEKWGVGVYTPIAERFVGGFHGDPPGETGDASTGYISPLKKVKLERDAVFEYEYFLIVGQLDEIRAFVYAKEGKKL